MDPLADIERRVEQIESPQDLLGLLREHAKIGDEPGERGVRYFLARGIVLNRAKLPGDARITLEKARTIAAGIPEGAALAPAISREIARVHLWQSDTVAAAQEILRAVVEAERAGASTGQVTETPSDPGTDLPRRDNLVQALVLFGQLLVENGRLETAVWVFKELLDPASGFAAQLTPRDRSRVPRNLCEAMVALGRFRECLDTAIPVAEASAVYERDAFVVRQQKVRCLIEVGRIEEAEAEMDAVRAVAAKDPSYGVAELGLLEGRLRSRTSAENAAPLLEQALATFQDQDLPRLEFEARALLIDSLFRAGREGDAERHVIEGLVRAQKRNLPSRADQIRTAALPHWRNDRVLELNPDETQSDPGSDRARFLILEQLGAGGFGTVHRAIDSETGTEVAIKRFRSARGQDPRTHDAILNGLRNEVRAAAHFRRDFVARTRSVAIGDDGGVILIQDFIAGPTLAKALQQGGLGPEDRLAIAALLVRAVKSLHEARIAHRDLKPGNIILRGGREPVLIDLGLARLKGAVDLTPGSWTEAYAPREQRRGVINEDWFGREDVYALGKILSEMNPEVMTSSRWRRSALALVFPGRPVLAARSRTMTYENAARRVVDLDDVAAALSAAAMGR